MKLLRHLLVFCIVSWASCQYNSIGLRKVLSGVTKDFKKNFAQVFSSIQYMEFYDISSPFNEILLDSTLTLSEIRLDKISFDASALKFNITPQDKSLNITSANNLNLKVTAELSANWLYKVSFAEVFEGTFSANLMAEETKFGFELNVEYNRSVAKVEHMWNINSSMIKGFGDYEYVHEGLRDIVQNQLFPKVNEELSKYGMLVLNLMTYGKSLRRIPVKGNLPTLRPYVIKSEISGLENPKGAAPLDVKFSSHIMDEMTHRKTPISHDFGQTEAVAGGDVSFYLGYGAAKAVFNAFLVTSMETFLVGEELQKTWFKYRLTVRALLPFYPRLADQYNPDKPIDLTCTVLSSDMKAVKYTCVFILSESPGTSILPIDELYWNKTETLSFVDADKEIVIRNDVKTFGGVVMKSVSIGEFAARQIMFFLSPVSEYLASVLMLKVKPVSEFDNWKVKGYTVYPSKSIEVNYEIEA
eukprot:TRINITY_DN337_c0_g2_i2.p1 TRINITY_DN337_c0_g2~~TRINITY_DN337_c0_g2_i2.p1  ORF type:complete len:471 (+),score=109.42 TRINITY_DN337_c0_g2_i2:140-1552(+)